MEIVKTSRFTTSASEVAEVVKTSRFTTSAGEDAEVAKARGPGQGGPDAFNPSPCVVRPCLGESLFDSTSHGNEDRPVIVQGSAGEIVRKKTNLCKRPPFSMPARSYLQELVPVPLRSSPVSLH